MKVGIHTSQQQFEELHRLYDKANSTTQMIKVPRQALINILMDHSTLTRRLEEGGDQLTQHPQAR